jgi:hypothetical protein
MDNKNNKAHKMLFICNHTSDFFNLNLDSFNLTNSIG